MSKNNQPPSGGCVLKLSRLTYLGAKKAKQPPSGGCVLKLPRAARRLGSAWQPPSGGCVLKHLLSFADGLKAKQPPSGGCVLKLPRWVCLLLYMLSRLQAAVC